MTGRGAEWIDFSAILLDHVENYTVPQYGDLGGDNVTDWDDVQCVKQIGKYVKRYESNARGEQEKLLDLKKAAHYACMAYFKAAAKLNGGEA